MSSMAGIALVLAIPHQAAAQNGQVNKTQNEHTEFANKTGNNPCTGESFTYNGKTDIQEQSGPQQFKSTSHEEGQGATPSGVKYQYQQWADARVQGNPPTYFKQELRKHVIRAASQPATAPPTPYGGDDFFMRDTMTCTFPNGVMTCQVGTPAPEAKCR